MITILHTNNLHGQLGMLPRLAALIARGRERDPDALLLDAGDMGLSGPTAGLDVGLLGELTRLGNSHCCECVRPHHDGRAILGIR